jgi:hypothetical protein
MIGASRELVLIRGSGAGALYLIKSAANLFLTSYELILALPSSR